MIIDGISVSEVSGRESVADRAVASFLKFIEKKLRVSVVRDARAEPFDTSLSEPLRLAKILMEHGVLKDFGRGRNVFPDEPPIKSWYAICNDPTSHQTGGTTWESDSDALHAVLAECLERYIWFTQDDYFLDPTKTTTDGIQMRGMCVRPEDFAGFSQEQRKNRPERDLRDDAEYLWVGGTSLVRGSRIYIPAQTVSAVRSRITLHEDKEPIIRQQTTIGLATWPTLTGARLAGALEVIERDAYMIMWLNQLTLPRLSLQSLSARFPELARNFEACRKYGLKTHVIRLLTDAPTHAIAVLMEDTSGSVPRFTIGLKAHRSLPFAIQKAMTEALRARFFCRTWFEAGNAWDMSTPTHSIGHLDRLFYWSVPEHAKKLEFMIGGPEIEATAVEWDNDDEEAHLRRIIDWCAKKNYECISVSLGHSSKNPTPWHIEMVVMPQLQPTYLAESLQAFGATRWSDVPKAYGMSPLKKPFGERPHPFS